MHFKGSKRWVLAEADMGQVEAMAKMLDTGIILSRLLVLRGLSSYAEAKAFFVPELKAIHDPFLMKNMDLAINRIEKAVKQKERILIYGDYDVDGTTAVSLLYRFLYPLYKQIDFYIPDRYHEGYGISLQGIDYAADNNFSLIIALDCGIRAIDQVEYAQQKGIDFIICDHHTPGPVIPDALAVLDPKQEDCSYPFNELSGCGIGFKLCQALAITWNIKPDYVYDLLDILVVSIAADIVPVNGENRILAWYGLKKLNEDPQEGLKTLLEVTGRKKPLKITDIVFGLAPPINAAGRLKHGRYPVMLLTERNEEEIKKISQQLYELNTDRKQLDQNITADALEILEKEPAYTNRKSTVVWGAGWHKGVIGIVASRLIEHYYRPTIVFTGDDGILSGSARSVSGFNILEAIDHCKQWIVKYGGHKYAAGLQITKENFNAFKENFNQYVSNHIDPDMLIPKIHIDAEVQFSDLTMSFYQSVSRMAPFGPGNMRPVFLSRQVKCRWQASIVGENHLKMTLIQQNIMIAAIAFKQAGQLQLVNSGPFDICFSIDLNEWNGKTSLQLNIKDIKPCK